MINLTQNKFVYMVYINTNMHEYLRENVTFIFDVYDINVYM